MCGIYGFSLKPGADKRSALNKLKILGLYNITRGRDASGIFINGEIIKKTDEFDDLIENEVFSDNFKGRVVLGHNRQGSFGYKKTVEEAHPFLINDNLVFTHNGTIKNTEELCKKYGVKKEDFNVDSKLLGTLLYTEGSEVLACYKGYAALAYTALDEPNTLFLFHGESKEYKDGSILEERPLYYMETVDGVFYSSLENSLKAIKEFEDEEPQNLAYNKIFKIQDGEFVMDEIVEIDRKETNVYVYTTSVNNFISDNAYFNRRLNSHRNRSSYLPAVINKKEDFDMTMIFKESYPIKIVDTAKTDFKIYNQDFIYSHMGRYWLPIKKLLDGPIYLKKGGIVSNHADKSSELCYFFHGVLLKDKEAYTTIYELSKVVNGINWANSPKDFNFAMEISKFSQYPVTNLPREYNHTMSKEYTHMWYKEKFEKKNDSFTPKFSGRSYTIKDSYLIAIKSAHREKCVLSTMYEVDRQLAEIMNSRVPGGSSALVIPFQEKEEKKEEDVPWFYESIYKNLSDFIKTWGELELTAFKKFLHFCHRRDFHLSATAKEIDIYMETIIEETISKNISIANFLEQETKGDSKLFFEFYEKELDSNNLVTSKINNSSNIEDLADLDNKILEIEQELEEELENEEEIDEEVESCIVSLEDLQTSSFELMNSQKSDFAQEVAKIMLTSSNNTLSNLLQPLHKYRKADLIKRVIKIRETKNVENGIL